MAHASTSHTQGPLPLFLDYKSCRLSRPMSLQEILRKHTRAVRPHSRWPEKLSPKDMSAVYKNSNIMTFNGFIPDPYIIFGMSKQGVSKMWQSDHFQA